MEMRCGSTDVRVQQRLGYIRDYKGFQYYNSSIAPDRKIESHYTCDMITIFCEFSVFVECFLNECRTKIATKSTELNFRMRSVAQHSPENENDI